MKEKKKSFRVVDIAYIAIAAALMAVCSWISVPTTVPFTMQTFAVFLSVYLLGGWRGTTAVLVYILLGAAGAPVFAGMEGGPAALFSSSGGYIIGFLFSALTMWGLEILFDKLFLNRIRRDMEKSVKKTVLTTLPYALSMVLALAVCYAFGTAWFVKVFVGEDGSGVGVMTALGWCVFPFILPDLCKIGLALLIGSNRALRRVIRRSDEGSGLPDKKEEKAWKTI